MQRLPELQNSPSFEQWRFRLQTVGTVGVLAHVTYTDLTGTQHDGGTLTPRPTMAHMIVFLQKWFPGAQIEYPQPEVN